MTLIEMMVVLVIMAVVAALIVPNVIGRPDEARGTVASTDIRTISAALEVYRLDNGVYPTTEQGLMALVKRPTSRPEPANWHSEGYLPQLPSDPWGTSYVYQSPAADAPFEVMSLGSDGKPGGEGAAADLSNRVPAK
jgi:general secretion pathway protein G